MQLWINMNKCDDELIAPGSPNNGIKGCGNVHRTTGCMSDMVSQKLGQTNSRTYPILDALYISHILLADYVLGIDLLTNTEPIELDNKLFS